jgi:hypothetical protein
MRVLLLNAEQLSDLMQGGSGRRCGGMQLRRPAVYIFHDKNTEHTMEQHVLIPSFKLTSRRFSETRVAEFEYG